MDYRMGVVRDKIVESGGWCVTRKSVAMDMMTCWLESGREVTQEIALWDLAIAEDMGGIQPHRYYAKRWRWSEGRAYRFLAANGAVKRKSMSDYISETITLQERSKSEAKVKQERSKSEAKSGEISTESASSEAPVKQERSSSEAPVKQPIISRSCAKKKKEKEKEEYIPSSIVRAGARDSAMESRYNTIYAYPSEEEVIEDGELRNIPADVCRHFWQHFTTYGWKSKSGQQIAHWGLRLQRWHDDNRKRTHTRQGASSGHIKQGKQQAGVADCLDYARDLEAAAAKFAGLGVGDRPKALSGEGDQDGRGSRHPTLRLVGT